MPPPNDAQPYLKRLPTNTRVMARVTAVSPNRQRVTVIVPGIGEHVFEGTAAAQGQPTPIGGDYRFTTADEVVAECWNEQQLDGTWYNYHFLYDEGDPDSTALPFNYRGVETVLTFFVDPTPVAPPAPSAEVQALRVTIGWIVQQGPPTRDGDDGANFQVWWHVGGNCPNPRAGFIRTSPHPAGGYTFRCYRGGTTTGRQCVQSALADARAGLNDYAISWLCAGQAHSGGEQRHLRQNPALTLKVLLEDFGHVG